jgi:hypothetical protein
MFLTWLMLAVALCLSAVAAFYSIVGLTAIFAAAVVPIIIMGSILEIAKLTVTVWLHEYWRQVKWTMKAYLVPAVGILMVITSMGIFGFLSKAHLDQAVPTGDVAAQVSLLDEKIRTQRDNIDTARRALSQMDAQVDQLLGRSADEKGAERAVQVRRNQAAERNRLQREIGQAQAEIAKLNEQRAPIAADLRKVEAEVGPIKYIAALIYGDNPDANLLEKAVRWVIIILVVVFDPLAIFMLLAATESYRWEKDRRNPQKTTTPNNNKEPDQDANVTDDAIAAQDMDGHSPGDNMEPKPMVEMVAQPRAQEVEKNKPAYVVLDDADDEDPKSVEIPQPESPKKPFLYVDSQLQEKLVDLPGEIDTAESQTSPIPPEPKEFDYSDDTITEEEIQEFHKDLTSNLHFGPMFPGRPSRGDLFLKINTLPTTLFKYNGEKWIQVNKNLTDRYAYNDQYIDFLITEISIGKYDPELLTDLEREQISLKLSSKNQ